MTQPDKSLKSPPDQPDWDPVYLHSRRELVVIIGLFALFFAWSLVVCYTMGYQQPGEEYQEISTVLGMPAWSFWGIALPWLVVDVVAVWFCFFYMKNDDLGEANEEAERHPEGAPPAHEDPRKEGSDHA